MTDDDRLAPPAVAVPDADELLTAWESLTAATVVIAVRLAAGLDAAGGLTPAEFDVLVRLQRAPDHRLPLTDVAAEIGLTSGGFTKLTDRMELDGVIGRERGPGDPRVEFAVLTEHGRQVTDRALGPYVAGLRRHLLAPLGTQGLRALVGLSEALRDQP